ncbi:hypothetical protein DDF67_02775 [Caulobacter endophyticus]|uniref:Haemolysin XhlA n=1 Tax=Caulobacter endophyticus TaxID=2172652 RepID=A0A2T9KCK7_9CAUL|nr:hypothetical protein DDF67_02775 [Caulobacter endophyticus]
MRSTIEAAIEAQTALLVKSIEAQTDFMVKSLSDLQKRLRRQTWIVLGSWTVLMGLALVINKLC